MVMLNVAVYQSKNYTAYLYPKKIVICNKYQCFRVNYDGFKNKQYIDILKMAILDGVIHTPSDIADLSTELIWSDCGRPCQTQQLS